MESKKGEIKMGKIIRYDAEYKIELCKRKIAGETVAEISRDTGIPENTIHLWLKRYNENSKNPFVGSGHIKPEDEEIKKLQRENRDLKEENEILKKAAAYFAKNQK